MKQLGSKALHQIEQLITTTRSPRNNKSSNRLKVEPGKSTKPLSQSPDKSYLSRLYKKKEPTEPVIEELDQQKMYKMQNPRSIFLNDRNPKPPIYQRAQEIMREREAMLEEIRMEKQRQKEDEQDRECEQFLKEQTPKKVISKQTAQQITDKLYKDHYSKNNRINNKKLERFREDGKIYRNKPQINTNTKEIYQKVAVKNQWNNDIINRFEQYQTERKEATRQREKSYKDLYYPFQPTISNNSRILSSNRKQRADQTPLSKTLNCISCSHIKQPSTASTSSRSPHKPTKTLSPSRFQLH